MALGYIQTEEMDIFSRKIYQSLDHIGYSHDAVQLRRKAWHYWSELGNKYVIKDSTSITAGSKAEGITAQFESDIDVMILFHKVLCINTADQQPKPLSDDRTVFLADMENTPPGYARLKLHRPSSFQHIKSKHMRACLFETESGETYLSSTLWTSKCLENYRSGGDMDGSVSNDVTGPALPITFDQLIDADIVIGFTFHCPQLLKAWASRRRQHEWPSEINIRTACSFLPQVVPVGAKGSDKQYQEWRFCFIQSELTLTHSLNGTQIKLYILLKTVAKQILKQVTSEISSYIMKNVTYWLSELLPLHVFREENLVSLVLLGLAFLRKAVTRWKSLPYYMIPGRNLLSERLNVDKRSELSELLFKLIQEGPSLFLRLEKLGNILRAGSHIPSYIVKLGGIRDQIEKRALAFMIIGVLKERGPSVEKGIEIYCSLHNLVYSYKRTLDPSWNGRDAEQFTQAMISILT